MSRNTKRRVIAAAILVLAGGALFAAAMTANRWDFSRLETDRLTTNTYEITESFRNIQLDVKTTDVLLALSDDGRCKVVCREQENLKHTVSVQQDTLTVLAEDDRAWYEHIGVSFHSPAITVYLPEAAYGSVSIRSSTGEINAAALTCQSFLSQVSTGTVTLQNVTVAESLSIKLSTGDVSLTDTHAAELLTDTTTGSVTLDNTNAEQLRIHTTTGDVVFANADADGIFVKTSTGNVTGTLRSEKVFEVKTSTGRINVPPSATGGPCEITTSTGDILLQTCSADNAP